MDYWIPIYSIPMNERPVTKNKKDKAVKVNLPDKCPICSTAPEIFIHGNEHMPSLLKAKGPRCDHFWTFDDLWKFRIKDPTTVVENNNEQSFGTCVKCGDINVYQSGPFTCYSCRQNTYR